MSGATVGRHLADRGVAFALIGAQAMGLRGVMRFSHDTDFCTTDRSVLSDEFWATLEGASVSVRRGEYDDPLAGLVKIIFPNEPVDVVVGRYKWQQALVARAETLRFGDTQLPVAQKPDLVLLKLFAGGPQDMWDIYALIESDSTLAAQVDPLIHDLPSDAQQLWQKLLRDLPPPPRDLQ